METISDAAEAAQRRQPHSLDYGCDGDRDRDGGGGDGDDDDDGDYGERTYVRSFARLARSAAESRAKERGGRNDSIKCESARRDGDGDGEATLKRTAAKVI